MEEFSIQLERIIGKNLNLKEFLVHLKDSSFLLFVAKSIAYSVFINASDQIMNELEFFAVLDKLCLFSTFKLNLANNNIENKRIEYHLNIWNGKEQSVDETLPAHELNRIILKDIPQLLRQYPDFPLINDKLTKPKELFNVYQSALKANSLLDSTRTHNMCISIAILNKDIPMLLKYQIMPYNVQLPILIKYKDIFNNSIDISVLECCKTGTANIGATTNCLCSQSGFLGALKYKCKQNSTVSIFKSNIYTWEKNSFSLVSSIQ